MTGLIRVQMAESMRVTAMPDSTVRSGAYPHAVCAPISPDDVSEDEMFSRGEQI